MSMRYPGGLIASTPVTANYPSGVWTQAQAIPYQAQNVWTRDQFWPYTTLLLQGDGAVNGAQNNTFLDSSSNNFTITRNGNTTQGAFTPYEQDGYWSNYFDGSGDYLTTPSNTAFAFGTGDFTVEAFVFITATNSQNLRVFTTAGVGSDFAFEINTSLQLAHFNGSTTLTLGGSVPLNQWVHIAWVRSGSTVTGYINGVSIGTATSSANMSNSQTISIGATASYTSGQTAYISNLRVVKGTAVYTSAFTPSTAPLTAITNTSLLTCQSNRFKDNSTNAFAITVNGSPSVQAFQPFPGATTWSASVLGGSGYFDGTGDSLTVPDSTAFTMGSGDFSVEFWYFPTSAARQLMVAQTNAAGSTVAFWVEKNSSNQLRFVVTVGGTQYVGTATATMDLNSWSFIQVVRSGTTVFGYQNGTQVCSASVGSGSLLDSTDVVEIGGVSVGLPVTGYISNVRILKGTASSAAVPTAPLTAITNTQLLLNMTNAGIYDNSMMNNLETVGNAQVSTSVVKYGTGSMAFDGTGDYLSIPDSEAWNYGSGNFTIEFWANFNVFPSSTWAVITSQHVDTNNRVSVFFGNNASNENGLVFKVVTGGTTYKAVENDNASISMSSLGYSTGVWYHVAIVRNGNSIIGYVNGVQRCTLTTSASFPNLAASQLIGVFSTAADFPFNGYIDDLRITKSARYLTTFTPPPARLPAQ